MVQIYLRYHADICIYNNNTRRLYMYMYSVIHADYIYIYIHATICTCRYMYPTTIQNKSPMHG